MTDQEKGIKPYPACIWGEPHWICGYCNEPVHKVAGMQDLSPLFCPDTCPSCGVRINKEIHFEEAEASQRDERNDDNDRR